MGASLDHPSIKRETDRLLSINGGVLPDKIKDLLLGKNKI